MAAKSSLTTAMGRCLEPEEEHLSTHIRHSFCEAGWAILWMSCRGGHQVREPERRAGWKGKEPMTLEDFGPLPRHMTKRRSRSAQFRFCALGFSFISNDNIARLRGYGWMDDRWAIVGLPSLQHELPRFCGPCIFSAGRTKLVNNRRRGPNVGSGAPPQKAQTVKP